MDIQQAAESLLEAESDETANCTININQRKYFRC